MAATPGFRVSADGRSAIGELEAFNLSGDPVTGAWCPRCALPSAVEADYALVLAAGVQLGVIRVQACLDCEWTSTLDDDPIAP